MLSVGPAGCLGALARNQPFSAQMGRVRLGLWDGALRPRFLPEAAKEERSVAVSALTQS